MQSSLEGLGVGAPTGVAGLPQPQLQYRLFLPDGRVRLDAARPDAKPAVEFDGTVFHADPEARQRDLRRDAALAALGWVVLRFSYADVTERPAACAAQVAAAYLRRRSDVPKPGSPAAEAPAPGTSWSDRRQR